MDSSCRITSLETMFINSFQNGESGFKASLAIIKVLGNHNLVKMLFILDQEWTKYKGEEKVKSYVLKHIKMSVFFHCAWHQEKTFYMDTENELHITRASLQFIQLLNHRSHQWLLFFFEKVILFQFFLVTIILLYDTLPYLTGIPTHV